MTPRNLLRVDAVLCLATGVVLAVAVDGWVRAVGVFLVAYAAGLAAASNVRSERVVRTATALTAVGDATWVIATAIVIGAGAFATTEGAALAAAIAVPVLTMGGLKTKALRSTPSPAPVLAAG
jgi:hypothetical protein